MAFRFSQASTRSMAAFAMKPNAMGARLGRPGDGAAAT
jgi:hypothetical protein